METRAHHLLIGIFMLALVVGLTAFVLWLANVDPETSYRRYALFFEGSVTGLNEGSTVQLNGVPVGSVRDISIPADDPSRVRVIVRIEEGTPILQGSLARLELQGLTGAAFVQISGGQPGNPPITADEGRELPIIPSERSAIQKVLEEAPNLLSEAVVAVNNVQQLFSDENLRRVSTILANVETLSARFADRAEDIDNVLASLDDTLTSFKETAEAFTKVAGSADAVIDGEIRQAFAEADDALAQAETLFISVEGMVAENRPAVTSFLNSALPEASRLVADLRRLTLRLNQAVEKFKDRPREALFGEPAPEYQPAEQNR